MSDSLIEQIDNLASVAKTITDDEVLQAVVTGWREILSSVPLPGDEMPADVADAIEQHVTSYRTEHCVWQHSDGSLYRLRRRPGESDDAYSEREQRLSGLRSVVLPAEPGEAEAAIKRMGLERIDGDER